MLKFLSKILYKIGAVNFKSYLFLKKVGDVVNPEKPSLTQKNKELWYKIDGDQTLRVEYDLNEDSIMYKPGVDYYPLSFAAMLSILIYTLLFFGNMTGKNSNSFTDALDKQQFSRDLVWTVIILILFIVIDRIIYKLRSINNEFIFLESIC